MLIEALLKLNRLNVYPIPQQLCGQRHINQYTKNAIWKRNTKVRARKKILLRICSFREAVNSFHTKKTSRGNTCSGSSRESNHKTTSSQEKKEEYKPMITDPREFYMKNCSVSNYEEVQKKLEELVTMLKKKVIIPFVSKTDKTIQKKGVTKQPRNLSSNKTAYEINQEIQDIKAVNLNPEINTATLEKETQVCEPNKINNTAMLSDYTGVATAAFAPSNTPDDSGHKCNDSAAGTHWRLLSEQTMDPVYTPKPTTKKEFSDHYAKPDPRVQFPNKPIFTRRSSNAADMRTRIKEEQMKLWIIDDKIEKKSNELDSTSKDTKQFEKEKLEIKEVTTENSHASMLNKPVLLKKMPLSAAGVQKRIHEDQNEIYRTENKLDATLTDTKQNEEDKQITKVEESTKKYLQAQKHNKPVLLTKRSSTAPNMQKLIQEKQKRLEKASDKDDSTSTVIKKIEKEQLKEISEKCRTNLHLPLYNKAILNSTTPTTAVNMRVKMAEKQKTISSHKLDSVSTNKADSENMEPYQDMNVISTCKISDYNSSTPNVTHLSPVSESESHETSVVKRIPLYNTPTSWKHKIEQESTDSSLLLTSNDQQERRYPVKHKIKQEPTDSTLLLTSNNEHDRKRHNYDNFIVDLKKLLTQPHESTCPQKKEPHPKKLELNQDEETYLQYHSGNTTSVPNISLCETHDTSSYSDYSMFPKYQMTHDTSSYSDYGMFPKYQMTHDTSSYSDYSMFPKYKNCSFRNTCSQHDVPASSAKDYRPKNTWYQNINPLDQLCAQGLLMGQKLTSTSTGSRSMYNSPLFNIQSSMSVPQQNMGYVMQYNNNVSDMSQFGLRNIPFDFMDTLHTNASYPPQSSYTPTKERSSYPPRKCLTSAEMLDQYSRYAKSDQTPQSTRTSPGFLESLKKYSDNIPMPQFSLPPPPRFPGVDPQSVIPSASFYAQPTMPEFPNKTVTIIPRKEIIGMPGPPVIPGYPAQGIIGFTGHEMLGSPGQIMPILPTQETIGLPGHVMHGLPGPVMPSLPGQVMPGLPTQVSIGLSGQVVPGLPGQVVTGLPGQIMPGLPTQVMIGLPGQVMPGLPGPVMPGLPGQVMPGLPGHVMPGLPGQVMPGLPGQVMPGFPAHETLGLPGHVMPGLPGHVMPGFPGQAMPCFAAQETVGSPEQVMTGLPTQEMLISPEQPTYLMQGQALPGLPVQTMSNLPDVAPQTVPAGAQQSILILPGQVVYSVPNSFPCP